MTEFQTIEYESSSSSDYERSRESYKHLQTSAFDGLKIYHVSAYSRALAKAGFTKHDLQKIYEHRLLMEEHDGKLPKGRSDFLEFAQTVDAMREMSDEEILALENDLVNENSSLVNEYSTMLHALGLNGPVFIDPDTSKVFTYSSVLARYLDFKDSVVTFRDAARESVKMLLKNLKSCLNPLNDDVLLGYLGKNAFDIAGISMFFEAQIVPSRVMSQKPILNGTLKSKTLYPFSHPVVNGNNVQDISRTHLSRAIQDLTGFIPVSFRNGSNGTQHISTYDFKYFDTVIDNDGVHYETKDRKYFYPIELPANGIVGDQYTSTLFQRYRDGCTEQSDIGEALFSSEDCLDTGYSYANPTDITKGFIPYPDEIPDVTEESGLWSSLALGKMGRVPGLGKLTRVNYKPVTFDQFKESYLKRNPSIKIIDVATFNTIVKELKQVVRKYTFVMPSPCAQTILAIPKNLMHERYSHLKNRTHMLNHPQYLFMWGGLGTRVSVASSMFFAACVLTLHETGECVDQYFDAVKTLFDSGIKHERAPAKRTPSSNLGQALFQCMWNIEIVTRGLIAFGPKKMKSDAVREVITVLSEQHLIDDYIDDFKIVESDDDMFVFDLGTTTVAYDNREDEEFDEFHDFAPPEPHENHDNEESESKSPDKSEESLSFKHSDLHEDFEDLYDDPTLDFNDEDEDFHDDPTLDLNGEE